MLKIKFMETHHWYTLISYSALCYFITGYSIWRTLIKYPKMDRMSDKYWERMCNMIWVFAYAPFSMPIVVADYFINKLKK